MPTGAIEAGATASPAWSYHAAMASKSNFTQRLAQLRLAFTSTREADPRLVAYLLIAAAVGFVIPTVLGVVFDRPVFGTLVGVLLACLAALSVFGRRASAAQFAAIQGTPGAAAAVLQSMRGPWRVTPAVAFTRKQDFVHRVVGRPGVIMVGEGSPARTTSLLKQEQRKVARAAGDVPVHTVLVGDGEGQVSLPRLQRHLMSLGRNIKAKEVGPLDTRLSALGGGDLPLPKGPLPRSPRQRRR